MLAPSMLLWHEEPALGDVLGVPVLLPGGVQLLGVHGPPSRDTPGGDPAVRSYPQGCAGSCRHQGQPVERIGARSWFEAPLQELGEVTPCWVFILRDLAEPLTGISFQIARS